MTEREMFDEWYLSEGYNRVYLLFGFHGGDKYYFTRTQSLWSAWQARAKIDKRNELS